VTQTLPLTVSRRGLTRQEVCQTPPIKLRFEKDTVKGTMFRGQKSLKMVTHCDKGSRWEQYYVAEMTIYQMYNLMTDLSFRVRPLSVTYIDSDRRKEDGPRFAFLIEDIDDVAQRNGMQELEVDTIKPSQLQPEEASLMALFQYMIANVDFDQTAGPRQGECCHNTRLIGVDFATNVYYAIPYDFDSSGLINTHYAAPSEILPIRYVDQRLFRGFCVNNPTLDAARQAYLEKESAIYAVIDNEERLASRSKKQMRDFLEEYFETLRDPTEFDREIIRKCRK